jgi:hypothetical protein
LREPKEKEREKISTTRGMCYKRMDIAAEREDI